jgi:deazaflavin-dependent oxidoreductase (nitroreductase family)
MSDSIKNSIPTGLPRLVELCYFACEYALMTIVPKRNPGATMGWIFKLPVMFYKMGLEFLIPKNVLILTTTGRKTGKKRLTPLGFGYDADENGYVVLAGWEGRTDWFRNLMAEPNVHIWLHDREFDCRAEILPLEKRLLQIDEYNRRNPFARRLWLHVFGDTIEDNPEGLINLARKMPSVIFRPILL